MHFVWMTVLTFAASPGVGEEQRTSARTSVVVRAPVEEVWNAFTTSSGIARTWGVARAQVDLRIGGDITTFHEAVADPRDEVRTEPAPQVELRHRILCFEPQRMLSLGTAVEESAPPWLREHAARTWSVVTMEPLSPERTQLTIATTAIGSGDEFDVTFELFETGHATLAHSVRAHFATSDEAARVDRTWNQVHYWTGGDWIAEHADAQGRVTRSRVRMRPILNRQFVLEESWSGEHAQTLIAHTIYGVDPETGAVSFWSFEAGGAVARGTVRLESERVLTLDWNVTRPDRSAETLECVFDVIDADQHRLRVFARANPRRFGGTPDVDLTYRRVRELPEGFGTAAKEIK